MFYLCLSIVFMRLTNSPFGKDTLLYYILGVEKVNFREDSFLKQAFYY